MTDWPGFEALPPSPPTEWPSGRPALPFVDPPPMADPPRRSRRRWLVVAASCAIAALVIGLFVVRRTEPPQADLAADTTTTTATSPSTTIDPSTSTSTSTTAPPLRPAIDEAVLGSEVDELSRFVEQERGLNFQRPVAVEALSDSDFRARVEQSYGAQREADEARGAMLRALGAIPPDRTARRLSHVGSRVRCRPCATA